PAPRLSLPQRLSEIELVRLGHDAGDAARNRANHDSRRPANHANAGANRGTRQPAITQLRSAAGKHRGSDHYQNSPLHLRPSTENFTANRMAARSYSASKKIPRI